MKRIIFISLFVGLMLSSIAFISAPQVDIAPFEGTFSYEVKYGGAMADNLRQNEANNELDMHIKDGSYIINLKGGRYPKTFLYVNKMDIEFSLNVSEKKAFKYSAHTDINRETHEQDSPEAYKIDKTVEVNGIMCDVYRMKKGNNFFSFFVSDQYVVNLDAFEGKKRAKPFFLVEGLDGKIPLKIIRKNTDLTVVTTVKEISPQSFSADQFELPEDFEVQNRDYRP